jgi:ABC-type polysaccharide/polyol phosphate export permease
LIFFVPTYVIILGVHGVITNGYVIGTTILIVVLTMISMISFGLFFAMLAILVRRIQPVAIFLNNIFQFVCGAFVPVQAFIGMHRTGGLVIKYIAHIFPYTYCYDLFRYYMFGSTYVTLLPVWLEYVLLFVSSLLFLALGYFLLKRVERKAKTTGLAIL